MKFKKWLEAVGNGEGIPNTPEAAMQVFGYSTLPAINQLQRDYRLKARETHPDQNPELGAKPFQRFAAAFDILQQVINGTWKGSSGGVRATATETKIPPGRLADNKVILTLIDIIRKEKDEFLADYGWSSEKLMMTSADLMNMVGALSSIVASSNGDGWNAFYDKYWRRAPMQKPNLGTDDLKDLVVALKRLKSEFEQRSPDWDKTLN